jgi:hypothetical protein
MTTENMTTAVDAAALRRNLFDAIGDLERTTELFKASQATSFDHSRARQEAISKALNAVAALQGVTLRLPLQIDSNGDYSIVATSKDAPNPLYPGNKYGSLAEVLNRHNPRCGMYGSSTLLPEGNWCMMNHFDVERMVCAENARLPL